VSLNDRASSWTGEAYRHIPVTAKDVLDFRWAAASNENRWNAAGEPTLYLAGDIGTRLWHFSHTGCVSFHRCHARIMTAAKERRRIGQLPLQGRMWPIRPPTVAISSRTMHRVSKKGQSRALVLLWPNGDATTTRGAILLLKQVRLSAPSIALSLR